MAYGARPVPQNIMSVEFKIFDFMTVKQFMFGFGLVLICGALFWILPGVYKIVVPLLLILTGGVVIFVPFNGDPFMVFLSSYLEALISPQRRVWYRKGVLVKSAYRAAKKYQYGGDYEEDKNEFKFLVDDLHTTPASEQKELDKEEEKFLQSEEVKKANAMPTQQNSQKTSLPGSSTSVSQKSIQTSVNLNKFTVQPTSPNSQTSQVSSPAPTFIQGSEQPQSTSIAAQPVGQVDKVELQERADSEKAPPSTDEGLGKAVNTAIKPSANVTNNNKSELNIGDSDFQDMTVPGSNPEDDEVTVKNFIFGNVEDVDGRPVANAAVVIKQGPTNLEVAITGQGGDFLTHYEYPEGEYLLHVNVGAQEFNEIIIKHDPIDPIPVLIRPKDYAEKLAEKEAKEFIPTSPDEEGVFEGAYDSKTFDIGLDYEDEHELSTRQISSNSALPTVNTAESQTNEHIEKPTEAISSPTPVYQDTQPVLQPQVIPDQHGDDIPFEERLLSRVEETSRKEPDQYLIDPQTTEAQDNQKSTVVSLKDINQKNNSAQDYQGGFSMAKNWTNSSVNNEVIYEQQFAPVQQNDTDQKTSLQESAVNNSIQEEVPYDYNTLPFSTSTFDPNFINIPNTVNGEIFDKQGIPLDGVLVRVKDNHGETLRSVSSDAAGRFYSFTSFPFGEYTVEFYKDGYRFNKYTVSMDGGTIYPKVVHCVN